MQKHCTLLETHPQNQILVEDNILHQTLLRENTKLVRFITELLRYRKKVGMEGSPFILLNAYTKYIEEYPYFLVKPALFSLEP